MAMLEFCKDFVYLKGRPISFAGRDYLRDVYDVHGRNLVMRCSRQVEKTTMIVNRIIYDAIRFPGIQMLLVCPHGTGAGL